MFSVETRVCAEECDLTGISDRADCQDQPGPEELDIRRGQRPSAEQLVLMLPQIEVQTAQGKSVAVACKEANVSERSDYRWRNEYGGLQIDQARRMKNLERENTRFRRPVTDLSLEKQVLKDVSSGNL